MSTWIKGGDEHGFAKVCPSVWLLVPQRCPAWTWTFRCSKKKWWNAFWRSNWETFGNKHGALFWGLLDWGSWEIWSWRSKWWTMRPNNGHHSGSETKLEKNTRVGLHSGSWTVMSEPLFLMRSSRAVRVGGCRLLVPHTGYLLAYILVPIWDASTNYRVYYHIYYGCHSLYCYWKSKYLPLQLSSTNFEASWTKKCHTVQSSNPAYGGSHCLWYWFFFMPRYGFRGTCPRGGRYPWVTRTQTKHGSLIGTWYVYT